MTNPTPLDSVGEGWYTSEAELDENTTEMHILPKDDTVEHYHKDCLCGTDTEVWSDAEFTKMIFITSHNSLDGRELHESDYEGEN